MALTGRRSAALAALVALVLAIAPAPAAAAGARPAALPADRLHFGLSNGPGSLSWMTSSGVPWRYRYTYIAGGLYSNPWPTWQDPAQPPGQYALDYMRNSAGAGYIPVLPYYMLLQSHRAADEATDDYNNLNNPTLMADYYANFRLLMQKAGQYGGQVMILVEPDLWGYLQQHSNNTVAANVSASVASSGDADVAAYPNNVQGFAQALQHLRDVYASNALLAYHASMWSSMRDIATDTDPTLNAATEADKTAAFFNSASPSGWNVVTDDVDDHDAGWWEAQGSPGHWWDPTNRQLPNFARYLAWVTELHVKTARPQIVWQVPEGNQYFLTENNTAGHYQDNVAEYFMNHTADLFAAGLIAVLFGAGNADQTTNEDTMGDGITNNGGTPTTDAAGWCTACNVHTSTVSDDDGGYLRMAVGNYYTPLAVNFRARFTWYDRASPGMVNDNIHIVNPGSSAVSGTVAVGGASAYFSVGPGQQTYVGFPAGTIGGPVVVSASAPVIASQRVQYYGSFNETPAQPDSTASADLWWSWYDHASPGMSNDNVHVINPTGSTVTGTVTVGPAGAPLASAPFTLAPGQGSYVGFPGVIGGPVHVHADSGAVLASQRVQYFDTFNEVPGRASTAASPNPQFTWYDLASPGMFGDDVHVVNPGSSAVTGSVNVGSVSRGFSVAAGADTYVTLPAGTIGGPVRITASGGVLASQRVRYFGSFNEALGASPAAAGTLWMPWYDHASPGMVNDNVHVVNAGSAQATVTVSVGQPVIATATRTVPVGQEVYVSFEGTIGGPVRISTDQPVIATQRVQYYQTFNEAAAGG